MYQYISSGLIFRGFRALEVKFFQLNLLHLRPGCHYTPVGCHGMPKSSHGGLVYTVRVYWSESKHTNSYFVFFLFFHSQEKRAEFPPSPKTKRQQDFGDIMVAYDANTTREGLVTTTLYISRKKVFRFIVFIIK